VRIDTADRCVTSLVVLVVNERDPVQFGNVRFLAGYRREWLINQEILADTRLQCSRFAGMSIAEAETSLFGCPKQFVRPALLHLVRCNEYSVLDEPLRPSTVLELRNELCRCESGNGKSHSLRRRGHRWPNPLRSSGSGGGCAPC
jgi:hypothetical protein